MKQNIVTKNRLSKLRFSYVIGALCSLLMVSCNNDSLSKIESSVAGYDFRNALKMIGELSEDDRASERARFLEVYILMAEGRQEEGFALTNKILSEKPDQQHALAKTLLDAVGIIVRDKSRCGEVITLLDSCIVYDPGLQNQALGIAWDRGIEYLKVNSHYGYLLMEFAIKRDSQIAGRLRSTKKVLLKRYDEFSEITAILALLNKLL